MKAKLTVNNQYPYLGLDAYDEEHQAFFHGRKKETKELLHSVQRNIVTVLFGKSGLGKTSLLRAGIMPKLRKQFHLPIYLRINFSDKNTSPITQAKISIIEQINKKDKEITDFGNLSLWEYFHTVEILGGMATPVLIFDQFEEIFTHGKHNQKQANEFITELTNLVENQIPISVQEKYRNDIPFTFSDQNFRVIISLREDFLPHLEGFNSYIPSLKKSRYRISQMNRDNAIEAVYEPGKEIISEDNAAKIVDLIFSETPADSEYEDTENQDVWDNYSVEPFLLSLICYQINELRIQNNEEGISNSVLEKVVISTILRNFYYHSTHDLGTNVRKVIENQLLTVDGYRKLQHKNDLLLQNDIADFDVNTLINRRIIRNVVMSGGEHLELVHDVIVPVVRENRDIRLEEERRIAREKELTLIKKQQKEKLEAERQIIEEKAKQALKTHKQKIKNFRRVLVAITIGCVVAIIAGVYAFQQKTKAENSEAKSNSLLIASNALLLNSTNPTLAFRLGENAYKSKPTPLATRAIRNSYYKNSFYNIMTEDNAPYSYVSFSPDGKYYVSVSGQIATIHDSNGNATQSLDKHTEKINCATFSNDGKFVVTASDDGTAKIWDIEGNLIREFLKHKEEVNRAYFSLDGKKLITSGNDNIAIIWNLADNQAIELELHTNDVVDAVFSSSGKYIATAGADQKVVIWNSFGEELHSSDLDSKINAIRFTPDEKYVAGAMSDSCVHILDFVNNKTKQIIRGHNGIVNSLEFYSNDIDTLLVTGAYDNTARLWSMNGINIQTFTGHAGQVTQATISPNGKFILTASSDKTVRIWKKSIAAPLLRFAQRINNACYSQDKRIILSTQGSIAQLWTTQGKEIRTLKGHSNTIMCADFSSDGNYIATGSEDGTIILWTLEGQKKQILHGHSEIILSVRFSPDNKKIISCGRDNSAIIWDTEGNILHRLKGHENWVNSAEFSQDGTKIITTSDDYNAMVWSVDGKHLITLFGHSAMVITGTFSKDGKYIATGSYDETIKLWDVKTGEEINTFLGHEGAVNSLEFSDNNETILSASRDKTIRIWNFSGVEVFKFIRHKDDVLSAQFTDNGKYVLSISADKTIRHWPIAPSEIIRLIDVEKTYGNVWSIDSQTRKKLEKLKIVI